MARHGCALRVAASKSRAAAWTQTLAWMSIFFFASAAASSAYLTASEIFSREGVDLAGQLVPDPADLARILAAAVQKMLGRHFREGGRLMAGQPGRIHGSPCGPTRM